MGRKRKMTGEERKAEITVAARNEFAKKGFYGTSMRDVARAAKVSEALIYRHFPSKDALYNEIYFYIDSHIEALGNYFSSQPPSTQTLVKMVYSLVNMIMFEMPGQREEQKLFERLLAYGLLENSAFVRSVFQQYDQELTPLWEASVAKAQEDGDMYDSLVEPDTKMWLSHHLIMAINLLHLSGESLFPHKKHKEELIQGMVVFILRGIGLSDETVQKYAKLKVLQEVVDDVFAGE